MWENGPTRTGGGECAGARAARVLLGPAGWSYGVPRPLAGRPAAVALPTALESPLRPPPPFPAAGGGSGRHRLSSLCGSGGCGGAGTEVLGVAAIGDPELAREGREGSPSALVSSSIARGSDGSGSAAVGKAKSRSGEREVRRGVRCCRDVRQLGLPRGKGFCL